MSKSLKLRHNNMSKQKEATTPQPFTLSTKCRTKLLKSTEALAEEYKKGSELAKPIPCPFVYANGRKCTGHITHVEAYKADVSWSPDSEGRWQPSIGEPRSHYHLFCSEKGNHAGWKQADDSRLKFYYSDITKLGIKLECF